MLIKVYLNDKKIFEFTSDIIPDVGKKVCEVKPNSRYTSSVYEVVDVMYVSDLPWRNSTERKTFVHLTVVDNRECLNHEK